MSDYDYDLIVIGAGSGGVRAARVAAAHGARVAIVEEYRVGGTCVIRGCVPKKLLIYGAHFAEDLRDARQFGWQVPDCQFDWPTLRDNVLAEVDRLEGLYRNTLGSHGVTILPGRGTIIGPHGVRIAGGQDVTSRMILVATGARPLLPSFDGAEHGISSNEAFHLDDVPRRIAIVGGGYIANEFAGIFNELGSAVTVINRSGQLLRGYDHSVRDRLVEISTRKGIAFRFDASFEKVIKLADGSLSVQLAGEDAFSVDCLMFAIGRVPNSSDLGLEEQGVEIDPLGAIIVDDDGRSTVGSIFAVGDVTNRIQLTPVAIREGQAFADTQFGGKPHRVDYRHVPSAVFSHPPIAFVGLTEQQARDQVGEVKIYTSDFRPMKNVLAKRDERALYKMICDADTDRILGLHMIGPDAPEILQAAAIAVKAGLSKAAFDETIALHPTMAEELVLLR
ncbi:glutathione-disulfide reductase [Rhizorhabdus dicambivorans]|uniref:Glutathione-disulfide reductase n=2 Tax=Sphingomonadaceae TaxID=41297 RepID=A0A2A4FV52_9SPHN|nr:glutathione-disulfide reductase [Rhizorhabdus dicambivorans]ATE67433.1 glutathione-disulfide reductase [Rhizorhabdus dicambivorans]PCE42044.1 glutathione-disulfide reductase [Rhizorhabdus dicambivorans]CAA12270.1 ORF 4 [Sphingomonas sp. RW5]